MSTLTRCGSRTRYALVLIVAMALFLSLAPTAWCDVKPIDDDTHKRINNPVDRVNIDREGGWAGGKGPADKPDRRMDAILLDILSRLEEQLPKLIK